MKTKLNKYILPFAGLLVAVVSAFAVDEGVNGGAPDNALQPQTLPQPSTLPAPVPVSSTPAPEASVKADTGHLIYPLNKQEYVTYEDLQSKSPADLSDPANVRHEVEYDPDNGYYIYTTKVGDMDISTPFVLNQSEYEIGRAHV